jgi:hemerythrin
MVAQGQVDYRMEGRILRTTATGPFNNELVAAIPLAISELIAKLVLQGKWGQIITFHRSAFGSAAAIEEFAASLRLRYTDSATRPVTALVFGPGVEDAPAMAPQFLKCYLDAGVASQTFEDYETALYWVESRIKQTSERLTWRESYRIGSTAIDEQHQEIFQRAADVIAATTRDGQTLSAMRLQRYALTHFSHEEDMMRRLGYPDISEHVRQHDELTARLKEISRQIANDNMVKAELEEFIARWLLQHIASVDAQLAVYLKQ